ncbi:MAG: valine--tRNA ligase [bacterium]
MAKDLPKAYQADKYEDDIYQIWEKSGFFNPDNLDLPDNAPNYTVILPPPNITDKLHLGHAAMLAIEDLFVRYHRMKGKRALWLPGTDHAAIATQTAVEKKIKAEENKSRHDLGKEEFLKRVDEFVRTTQSTILNQTRKMGTSLDWSRLAWTLDDKRQKAVKEMFVQMHEAGLIYRGDRIVNWCPHCASTLADDEVEYEEEQTTLYTFKYDKDFPFAIATTRPETKLGDTGVAVNPKDERYQEYIGKELSANFCGQKLKLKVIADPQVEMDFGTGALGVTPAHSMSDWLLAQEHDLRIIKVINEQANININEFKGNIKEVRKMIVQKLKNDGLLLKEEKITHNISKCYRCETLIEPLTSLQWFVAVDKPADKLEGASLKQKAIKVVEDNLIEFLPERFKKRYLDWMNNLRDWCISRQIWFGHSIPAWYKGDEIYVGREEPEGDGWKQDTDTLDTWFSSGMWTFSTLGWPEETKDLDKFHPTQLMETGYEIITLWISRMIMMSLFALGEIPFEKVYLHGMILDKDGKKMSKSRGNGIDPLDMIKLYGTDAVRLSLLIGTTPGNDVRMYEEKIAGYRNFVNKLWNISRFMLSNIESPDIDIARPEGKTLADKWILSTLDQLVIKSGNSLDKHDFSCFGEELKEFTWNTLADWYLEIVKIENSKSDILNYILNIILKLWHPFMPFVTESVWEEVYGKERLLMVEKWPNIKSALSEGREIEIIKDIIVMIRNARSENKIAPSEKIKAVIHSKDAELIKSQAELIKNLRTGISELEIKESGDAPEKAIAISKGSIDIYLIVEIDLFNEKARLEKEIVKLEKLIKELENKLSDQDFISKAPPKIVKQEREKMNAWQSDFQKIKQQLDQL